MEAHERDEQVLRRVLAQHVVVDVLVRLGRMLVDVEDIDRVFRGVR